MRPLSDQDVPGVANLFMKVFRRSDRPAPRSLREYLRSLYLDNPWVNGEQPSFVYSHEGGPIQGFIGGIPRPMRLGDRSLKTLVAGNFMVDPSLRDPLPAVRILRKFLSQPYDLIWSDSANDISKKMWSDAGAHVLRLQSLRWIRILRPLSLGSSLAFRTTRTRWISTAFSTIAAPPDLLCQKVLTGRTSKRTGTTTESELSIPLFLDNLPRLTRACAMRPDYDSTGLAWLLSMSRQKKEFGHLNAVAVSDSEQVIGWYLYYAARYRIGQILQIAATEETFGRVFNCLVTHAMNRSCNALMGTVDPRFIRQYADHRCVLFGRNTSTIAFTHDPAVLDAINKEDALLGRMEGEWWTRLQGDRFEEDTM